ncbi:MAG: polysaccharide deacetylase family protein [Gemmatimonadales bacterium]|jgi:peptidoglycan/xylan/chitin deacetylase (PgdA/CDA1 family)
MRRLAKTILERAMLRVARASLLAGNHGAYRVILAYHNVIPDGRPSVGESSLHISRSRFCSHLDVIQELCVVSDLGGLIAGRQSDSRRPVVAITFDDAYRGAVTIAAGELAARGLPATFFVCPSLVGTRAFWWDRVASSGDNEVPSGWRVNALNGLGGDAASIVEWAGSRAAAAEEIPEIAVPCGDTDLSDLARQRGMTVASHSWSHRNLAILPAGELRQDLVASHQWLLTRFGAAYLPVLAYPYGCWSEGVGQAARAAGYIAALRVEGGRFREPAANRFAVPRISVPAGLSREGLALRLLGVLSA